MKIWIEKEGKTLIGEGRYEILKEIEKKGSLAGAARSLGMSYKKVIRSIEEMEEALGERLVERYKGGIKKGGAALTEKGKELVRIYEKMLKEALKAAERIWEGNWRK